MSYPALRELYFLNLEVDLVITIAGLARQYRETGNAEHYEISKRNVFAAFEEIDHSGSAATRPQDADRDAFMSRPRPSPRSDRRTPWRARLLARA
jgi:hypothetical protein